jgi:diguanylate cyclase (GGDEF)-like protein
MTAKKPATPRLRKAIIGVAVLSLVVIQLFAVVISGISARDSAISVARDAISREGATTIQSILRYLEPAEQSAEVTSRLLNGNLLDTEHPGLERYLYTQLAVMPQMTGAFVGFPNGDFVFVSREDKGFRSKRIAVAPVRAVEVRHYNGAFEEQSSEVLDDDTFDPRQRPWYIAAADTDALRWTDPYVFFSSKQPGVTAAKAVRGIDGVSAVVGVDVELTGLATFLDNLAVAKAGEAFVVSGDTVVAAPSSYASQTVVQPDGSLRLLTTTELGVPALTQDPDSEVQRVDTGAGHDLVLHRNFPADQGLPWGMVIRAPESGFTSVVQTQQRRMLWISIGGGLLVLAAMAALLRVTRPIVKLHHQASTDALTGVANRHTINEQGAKMVADARHRELLSVLLIDLDGFKTINDRHGHQAGDEALTIVGEHLRQLTRGTDLVGRLGGDEFVIVQRVKSAGGALESAQRILLDLGSKLRVAAPEVIDVGASGGLTVTDDVERSFESLLREADGALLSAKAQNKGTVVLAQRMTSATL